MSQLCHIVGSWQTESHASHRSLAFKCTHPFQIALINSILIGAPILKRLAFNNGVARTLTLMARWLAYCTTSVLCGGRGSFFQGKMLIAGFSFCQCDSENMKYHIFELRKDLSSCREAWKQSCLERDSFENGNGPVREHTRTGTFLIK